jgi:hypothetical protein
MRIVTWNCCRGPYVKKSALLDPLDFDIAVIQECAMPAVESSHCLWFGDNPRQGIAVVTRGSYQLRRLPIADNVPKYVVPVEVTGPTNFTLLAVWSKGGQRHPYVEGVVHATELYGSLLDSGSAVLAGDLNSNTVWDGTHPKDRNHTALVNRLAQLGLVSAYHAFYSEAHGHETRPTYYFHWKEQRPYHIDYCFVPNAWAQNLRSVEVASYEDWKQHSDHRPLLIDVGSA